MLKEIKRSDAAISTVALAIVAVLVIAAAAVGIYVFVLSDDKALPESDTDDNDQDDEGNGDWSGLDFSDPMIEGTLGVGTTYTYDCTRDGVPNREMTISITGQSGSYYVVEFDGLVSDFEMVHKSTGQIRFSEPDGTEGKYKDEVLNKWKHTVYNVTETSKEGDVTEISKMSRDIVFLSNSKSILPYEFYLYNNYEVDGEKTASSYVIKGVLKETSIVSPTEYTASKNIGNKFQYSITIKDGDSVIGQGHVYLRYVGDIGSDKHLVVAIAEEETANEKYSAKGSFFIYDVADGAIPDISSGNKYDKDVNIDTKWGNKECALYYYESSWYDQESEKYVQYRSDSYIGKDDKITYFEKGRPMFFTHAGYSEMVLEEYVLN